MLLVCIYKSAHKPSPDSPLLSLCTIFFVVHFVRVTMDMLLFQCAKLLASFQPIYLQELKTTTRPSQLHPASGLLSSYPEYNFLKYSNVVASVYIIFQAKDFITVISLFWPSGNSRHSCVVPSWVLKESDGCGHDRKPHCWQHSGYS